MKYLLKMSIRHNTIQSAIYELLCVFDNTGCTVVGCDQDQSHTITQTQAHYNDVMCGYGQYNHVPGVGLPIMPLDSYQLKLGGEPAQTSPQQHC